MADGMKPAWELEQEARAVNATDWEPLPWMAKKRCSQCRYATISGRNHDLVGKLLA